jgi:hypothetical protein
VPFLPKSLLHLFYTEIGKCFLVRYEGLSDKYLSCPVQKILLLAGTDRLDRFVISEKFSIMFNHGQCYSILCCVPLLFFKWVTSPFEKKTEGKHYILKV